MTGAIEIGMSRTSGDLSIAGKPFEPKDAGTGGADATAPRSASSSVASAGDGDYSEQWSHIEQKVVIRRTADYCVVISPKDRLDWGTSVAFDDREKNLDSDSRKSRSDVLADIAVAEATPCDDLSEQIRIAYRTLLGEAIVLCFEGEYASARRIVERAHLFLKLRNEETSRYWYVMSSAKTAALFIVIAVLTWAFRDNARPAIGTTAFWLLLSCCGGAIGAALSVIVRSGNLQFDACAGKALHDLEGTCRIVAGAISGLIVAMAVRSDMVFGAFTSGGHLTTISMLSAVAAGTGERLATSIISKFDETQDQKDTDARN